MNLSSVDVLNEWRRSCARSTLGTLRSARRILFLNVRTVQLKCDGTRWRTRMEVKGKLANVVGSQFPSHYLGTWCIQHYYRWCAHLGCQQSIELTPTADLNGLVRFAERHNLVSARVPSHFKRSLPCGVRVESVLATPDRYESWPTSK